MLTAVTTRGHTSAPKSRSAIATTFAIEPVSAITAQYNADMAYWLQDAPSPAPAIELHEIARVGTDHEPFVSASRVRAYLAEGRLDELRPLVPASTYAYLVGDKPKHTEGEPAREHHP